MIGEKHPAWHNSSHAPQEHDVTCEINYESHPTCTGWSAIEGRYIDWDNQDYVPSKRVKGPQREALRGISERSEPLTTVGPPSGFQAGLEGSERAASRWDEGQVALVDRAIVRVATAHRRGLEFTSDAIWAELNGSVPVTKGLTARLMLARRRGLIDTTGGTKISRRGGHHDHGQRLSVWYSLVD